MGSIFSLLFKVINYTIAGYVVYMIIELASRRWRSSISHIRGPAVTSWIYGNMPDLLLTKNYGENEYRWQKAYGMTYRIQSCIGEEHVFTSDPMALKYIFNNNELFSKSLYHRNISRILFGNNSIFGAYPEDHQRLRSVLNPAFTPAKIAAMLPTIQNISRKVTNKLAEDCAVDPLCNVWKVIQNATTDVIAEVFMGYNFDTVETGGDKISNAHLNVIALSSSKSKAGFVADSITALLPSFVPRLAMIIPSPATRTLREYKSIMVEWSDSLLKQKSEDGRNGIERYDLLSIVVETNESKGRLLSESEMKDQIPSMLVAGQDTTGTTIAFALYEFAKRPEWQEQVRAEIRENGECVTTGDYDKLSLLNAQLKETLRCYPALPNIQRESLKDTILPLSEPIMTTDGQKMTEIPIRKGDVVFGGLASYNRSTGIWGDDADIFDPSRWIDGRSSRASTTALGPYSNLASFIGGARACLGWRLGILELQVILAELLSKFKFELDEGVVIRSSAAVTLQPVSQDGTAYLPLRVTMLNRI